MENIANDSIPDAEDRGRDDLRQEEGGEVSRGIVRKGANDRIPDAEDGGRDDMRQAEGGEVSRRIVRNRILESRLKSGQNEEYKEEFKEGVRKLLRLHGRKTTRGKGCWSQR